MQKDGEEMRRTSDPNMPCYLFLLCWSLKQQWVVGEGGGGQLWADGGPESTKTSGNVHLSHCNLCCDTQQLCSLLHRNSTACANEISDQSGTPGNQRGGVAGAFRAIEKVSVVQWRLAGALVSVPRKKARKW